MKSARFVLAWIVAGLVSLLVAAEPIDFEVDIYPPFINQLGQSVSGPMIDSVTLLLSRKHLEPRFQVMPTSRILRTLSVSPKTCAFAIPFDPALAETVSYIARVAPITLSVFATRTDLRPIRNIEDLRGYQVGALDIAEVRDLLDSHGISYLSVRPGTDGTRMLIAHRFDVLIGDNETELQQGTGKVHKLIALARVERWLACEKSTPPAVVATLRSAMKEGVFPLETKDIWEKHGFGAFYVNARQTWGLVGDTTAPHH